MRRIPRISNKFRASKLKATSISYPDAYIEEVSRGARTIEGVATSITAFVGRTVSGPVNEPATIKNYADFERVFGGLWEESQLGYAVRSFYQNGGREAIIVRLTNGGSTASISLPTGAANPNDNLELLARNVGSWGRKLRVTVGHDTSDPADTLKFNLLIEDPSSGSQEKHINVSVDDSDPRFIGSFLEQRSQLVVAAKDSNGNFVVPNARPNAGLVNANIDSGNDGAPLTAAGFTGPGLQANKEGLYALARITLFNLLVIPPYNSNDDVDTSVINEAALYCERRRAFYIIDPPSSWTNAATAESGIRSLGTTSSNAAVYFPRVRQSDPLQNNQIITLAPGGTLAGIYVRTDMSRGIWKAPAGIEANLRDIEALEIPLTELEINALNPLGLNCLKSQVPLGLFAWGSRTLQGNSAFSSEWKYIPVRRTALFIEESVDRGTKWAVIEPNNANLWSQIIQSVETFMYGLFRQGAFQGTSLKECYFVKCGLGETMTQNDIDEGRLIIQLGFAPLKPAEFVVITVQQRAAQP